MSPRRILLAGVALLVLGVSSVGAQSPSPVPSGAPGAGASPLAVGSPAPRPSLDPTAVRLAEAALATVATDRVAVDATITLESPERAAPVTLRATGRVNMSDPRRMVLDADMTPFGLGTLRLVLDGQRLLIQSDLLGVAWGLPSGTWLEADLHDTDPLTTELVDIARRPNDTAVVLLYLLGSIGPVAELGTERIGGRTTTRLTTVVDLDLALARVPGEHHGAFVEHVDRLRTVGVTVVPMEAWVDQDGMVRRVAYTLTIGDAPVGPATVTSVTDLSRFGRPLDLPVPPRRLIRHVRDLVSTSGDG